jgi:Lipase (class 3)
MIPNDVDLVNLSAAIYDDTSNWDHLDPGTEDGVFWGLKKLDGCDVVVFRGSITALDWWRDLRAAPLETKNIGTVHEGFHAGMEHTWTEIKAMANQPVVVTGHSLGAARADILCGIMAADKMPPVHCAVFGSPRPGLDDFAKIVRKGVPSRKSYVNGDDNGYDRVSEVPLRLFGKLAFVHVTPPTMVCAPPPFELIERYGLFGYHHIPLYVKAVTGYFAKEYA